MEDHILSTVGDAIQDQYTKLWKKNLGATYKHFPIIYLRVYPHTTLELIWVQDDLKQFVGQLKMSRKQEQLKKWYSKSKIWQGSPIIFWSTNFHNELKPKSKGEKRVKVSTPCAWSKPEFVEIYVPSSPSWFLLQPTTAQFVKRVFAMVMSKYVASLSLSLD